MRKDLILYIVAGVFFILTAISLILNSGQLYVVATAVIGLAAASAGFLLKPRVSVAAATRTETIQPIANAPAEQTSTAAVPTVAVEAPVAIIPKSETPLAETPTAPTAIATQAPTPQEPKIVEPAPPTQISVTIIETSAQTASATPISTESTSKVECTTIRGISVARAQQLKDYGINCIEDLAKASPTDLAVKLQVSEKIVKMWVGSAKKIAK